jgi:hypothetical protein
MAKAAGFAQIDDSSDLEAFNLQPHRTETFKLSTDPLFVERRAISAAFSCRCLTRLILCVA